MCVQTDKVINVNRVEGTPFGVTGKWKVRRDPFGYHLILKMRGKFQRHNVYCLFAVRQG